MDGFFSRLAVKGVRSIRGGATECEVGVLVGGAITERRELVFINATAVWLLDYRALVTLPSKPGQYCAS